MTRLQRQDIFCRLIKVDFAAHSPQMEPLRADLERALEGLQPRPASVPIYSTVTGQVSDGLSFDPVYWTQEPQRACALFDCGSAVAGRWT